MTLVFAIALHAVNAVVVLLFPVLSSSRRLVAVLRCLSLGCLLSSMSFALSCASLLGPTPMSAMSPARWLVLYRWLSISTHALAAFFCTFTSNRLMLVAWFEFVVAVSEGFGIACLVLNSVLVKESVLASVALSLVIFCSLRRLWNNRVCVYYSLFGAPLSFYCLAPFHASATSAQSGLLWPHAPLSQVSLVFSMLISCSPVFMYALLKVYDTIVAWTGLEDQFKHIFENSLEGFIVIDQTSVVRYWNPHASKIFGWSASEAVNRKLSDLIIPPEFRKGHEAGIRRYLLTGEAPLFHRMVEVVGLSKSGERIPVELSISPLKLGPNLRFCAFIRDASERRKRIAELEFIRDEALRLAENKTQFMGNVSHEIRSPLHAIMGLTEGLIADLPPSMGPQIATGNLILQSADLLLSLVNDVLDLSKLEHGKQLVHRRLFSLMEIIEQCALLLAAKALDKGLVFSFFFMNERISRASYFGDAAKVLSMLINLVGNAIKYTECGRIVVVVRETASRPGEEAKMLAPASQVSTVRFEVADSGIGIAADAQQRIWEPFQQVESNWRRTHGGAGLGLAIVQKLANVMEADSWVCSSTGVGSRFFVDLPLVFAGEGEIVPSDGGGATRPLAVVCPVLMEPVVRTRLQMRDLSVFNNVSELEEMPPDRQYGATFVFSSCLVASFSRQRLVSLVKNRPTGMTLGHLFLVLDGRDHVADDVWQPIPFVSVLDWSMSDSALQGVIWGLDHASCFTASLGRGWAAGADPAGISESSCSHAEAVPHNALGGNPRNSAARTVLVVEDGKVNQTVICRQLERLGFFWVLAEDGEEGFKLATREHARFCLVLMDAHMPKMDGLEATRRIRQWEVEHPSFPALHIVALTAAALPEDRQAFFDAGVDGFESKPLRLQRLRELLAALPSE